MSSPDTPVTKMYRVLSGSHTRWGGKNNKEYRKDYGVGDLIELNDKEAQVLRGCVELVSIEPTVPDAPLTPSTPHISSVPSVIGDDSAVATPDLDIKEIIALEDLNTTESEVPEHICNPESGDLSYIYNTSQSVVIEQINSSTNMDVIRAMMQEEANGRGRKGIEAAGAKRIRALARALTS